MNKTIQVPYRKKRLKEVRDIVEQLESHTWSDLSDDESPKRKRFPKKFFKNRGGIQQDENLLPPQVDLDLSKSENRLQHIVRDLEQNPLKEKDKFFGARRTILSKQRKLLLWLNPGTEKVLALKLALQTGSPTALWAQPLIGSFSIGRKKLLFENLPVLTKEMKQTAVKKAYYSPRLPSTIVTIWDFLQPLFANVTRKDVKAVLRTLYIYQINQPRRLPKKIASKFMATYPGSIIQCDMFFPTPSNNWKNANVLVMVDMWSRFSRAFAVEKKNYETVRKAMLIFFKELGRLGVQVRKGLADMGTDLSPFKYIMEAYRLPKDGKKPMVMHSVQGMPISYIESLNSQYERRLQVFGSSKMTNDVSKLLNDISNQLNDQKIPSKQNFTPNELIRMRGSVVKRINRNYVARENNLAPMQRIRELKIGDSVRILQLTRKEQFSSNFKQFSSKWTANVYKVLKISSIRSNPGYKRYYVSTKNSFYRWELLYIHKGIVDKKIPNIKLGNSNIISYIPDKKNSKKKEKKEVQKFS